MKLRIAGFVVLIIGAILLVLLISSLIHDVPVWIFGQKTTATIQETWWQDQDTKNLNKDDLNLVYFFSYQFTTTDKEVIIGSSQVTEEEFISYQPGGEIKVKYSRLDPSENRMDDSRFVPFLLCTYIPFILICLFLLAAGREMINF